MQTEFEGLGWLVRLRKRGNTYYLNLAKEVVLGNCLRKGHQMHYYLGNVDGRKVVLVFLDGEEREDVDKVKVNSRTFLVRKR